MAMLYVVRRRGVGIDKEFRAEDGRVAGVFADRAAAESALPDLESAAGASRRDAEPFESANELSELTTLPSPLLHDWFVDAGMEPPAKITSTYAWYEWWRKHADTLTSEQLSRFWEAFDKYLFYEIAEVEFEE
jgi:hypothetical protein